MADGGWRTADGGRRRAEETTVSYRAAAFVIPSAARDLLERHGGQSNYDDITEDPSSLALLGMTTCWRSPG